MPAMVILVVLWNFKAVYKTGKKLGEGSLAQVFVCKKRDTGVIYINKAIKKRKLNEEVMNFTQKIHTMKNISHD